MSATFIFQEGNDSIQKEIELPKTNFGELENGIKNIFKLSSVEISSTSKPNAILVSLDGFKEGGKYLVKGEKAPPSTASDQKDSFQPLEALLALKNYIDRVVQEKEYEKWWGKDEWKSSS